MTSLAINVDDETKACVCNNQDDTADSMEMKEEENDQKDGYFAIEVFYDQEGGIGEQNFPIDATLHIVCSSTTIFSTSLQITKYHTPRNYQLCPFIFLYE